MNDPGPGAGNQGNYNQAIAVSPIDCNTFAIGWREGTFVSFDGGSTTKYTKLDDGGNGHLHGDYHAVLFDPDDPKTIFMGSDGGLASAGGVVANGTPSFRSDYNKFISNLQFYHISPSFNTSGLVAGPLQDNGVVWTVVQSTPFSAEPWTQIVDSDGEYSEFLGVGVEGDDVQEVLIAVAPIVGTARVASAAGKMVRALGLAIAVADSESEERAAGAE